MAKRVFKTKKKLSGGNNIYRAWDKWSEGDYIIGTFVGEGPNDKWHNPTYQIKIEEAVFSDKKAAKELIGQVVTLNNTGGFGKSMKDVSEGDMLQIEYTGQNEITKGEWKGEMAHAIEVDLVEEEGAESDDDEEQEESEEDEDDL